MPAVFPRARVRLGAVAVALCVSSTLIAGAGAGPAQAAGLHGAKFSTGSSLSQHLLTVGTRANRTVTKPISLTGLEAAEQPAAKHRAAQHPAKKPAKHPAHHTTKHASRKSLAERKAAAKAAAKAHRALDAERLEHEQISFGERVIADASQFRGTPYEFGAAGPSRFDCSGFTRYIFAKFGISLPHSSSGQYGVVRHVESSQKQVGDLVFFHTGSGHVYHVGIYAGNDEIWAATHTGDYVRLEGMWSVSYYVGRITV